MIELGVENLSPCPNAWPVKSRKPLISIAGVVDVAAWTRDRARAIEGLDTVHHSSGVADQTIVEVREFLERASGLVAVIDRIEKSCSEELSQLCGVYATGFVAGFEKVILAGIANDEFGDQRLNQIVQPY